MATTYKAEGLYRAHRARPVYDGLLRSVSSTILIPSGTLLANADIIRFFRVAPSQIAPTRLIVDCSGPLDGHATAGSRTLTATLGYLKSSDRSGTNLSYLVSTTTTAATESSDLLLLAASAPVVNAQTTSFANAGAAALLTQTGGGVAVFNHGDPGSKGAKSQDSRGYDANVMDVALTMTANSSTATTADVYVTVTLEYAGVTTAPSAQAPFLYRDRYNSSYVSSL